MSDRHPSSIHPLLPPTTEEDRISWLRLLRSRRVGNSTFYRMMGEYGSARAALEALPNIAAEAGVKSYRVCPKDVVEAEMRAAAAARARLICIGDAEYPALLAEISDAPPVLWVRGNTGALRKPMIAIVGARNASSLGARMTRSLARELSIAGYVVVSGLARGVDTCAHLASAEHGSIAVLAGGVDILYPAENTLLAESMLETGAIISEQPLGMAPMARHFPMRNRIISGLCRATVVIEAASKSGSLITARDALDQGRDVLAVPGHPFDARAAGCNMLIRDGATLVRGADDVIERIGLPDQMPDLFSHSGASSIADHPAYAAQTAKAPVADLTTAPITLHAAAKPETSLRDIAALHQRILDRLGPSPVAEDQLTRDVGLSASQVSPLLTDLELDGSIRRAPGGLVSRA